MAKNFVKLQPYELTEEQVDDIYKAIYLLGIIGPVIPKECIKAFYIPGPSMNNINTDYDIIKLGTIEARCKTMPIYGSNVVGSLYLVPEYLKKGLYNSIANVLPNTITPVPVDHFLQLDSYTSSGPFIGIVLVGYDVDSNLWNESAAEAFNSTDIFYKYESPNGLCP